jgi:four helix bundle protein
MDKETLKLRTKTFGLRVMKLVRAMPKDLVGKALANQLIRSGTSVGANYRSACRGRSKAEWIAKLGICLEEADESAHWLELIMEDGMLSRKRVEPLWKEADELCAIFYTAIDSARRPS